MTWLGNKMNAYCLRCFLLALTWFFGNLAFAQQNAIQSIESTQLNGVVQVKFTLKKELTAKPTGFITNSPPRVALDFSEVKNATGQSEIAINLGDVKSVNLVQAGDRLRALFNLARSLNYTTKLEGNQFIVSLTAAAVSNVVLQNSNVQANVASVSKDGSVGVSLRDIDFRRGDTNDGLIVVDLTGGVANIDVKQRGQMLTIDFLKTKLPEVLRRRLDVTDFGTPVKMVSTFAQGENVRMVIESRGTWEHSVYQTDAQLIVSVKSIKQDPNKLTQGSKGYKGDKLSLNFQNIDVRSILQVIADFTGLNIITSDSVSGNLTLRLKDVPWDQALDIVMQAKNLDMRKNGNVIWIAPKDEILTKEKLELEAKAQIADLEPLKGEIFQLNYSKAADFEEVFGLKEGGGQRKTVLSKRGTAVVDPRSNQLFVRDIPSKLAELADLIKSVDVPSRQVLIEARIVEASDDFTKNLGARLAFGFKPKAGFIELVGQQTGTTKIAGGSSPDGEGFNSSGLMYVNGNSVTLPAAKIAGTSAGAIATTIFNSSLTRFLSLELSALEADGLAKIVSSPRVSTADQLKAIIEQGVEIPYQEATSSGATSVSFRKANLKLEVTPQITPDGNVVLDVDVNKDSVGIATAAGLAINTKHLKTQVLVQNGGTVMLGGIYSQEERDDTNKVPVLGDIPVLGRLFKNNSRVNKKTELLIFITPKILDNKLEIR